MRMHILAASVLTLAACASVVAPTVGGYYAWGHEVESFTPCGSSKSFWVTGEPDLLQQLRDMASDHSRATGKLYQPIYVEVSGMEEPKATDGFAADYDGIYRFTRVHAISQSAPVGCGPHG